jgi:hypothetical protein
MDLLQDGVKFFFSQECHKAMNYIKEKLSSYPVLRFPDLKKQFIITCDSSGYVVGCVLTQIGEDGEEHPVAYASRRVTKAEQAYHTLER